MECSICGHIKDCRRQCMDLPEGKTCRDCTHVAECTELFGAEESDRKCGFEPVLFEENGKRKVDITQSAVRCIDMEIEPDGIQIQHETWFDVDAYFGTDTRDKPDVWICFYTYWHPLTGVWAVYEIEAPENAIRHDWALTKDGANAIADLIQALYGIQGKSVVVTTGYYDQKEDERNGSKKDSMRLYSTKYFIELRRAFIQL